MRRLGRMLAPALVLLLALAGCGNPLQGDAEGYGDQIVIGASDVGESLVLAQLYAGALRNAGSDVVVRPPVGSREVVVQAMQDKSLSLVADYSGNLLQYFDENSKATSSKEVYRELKRKLPAGLEVLEQAPAENKDQLVVDRETADGGISSIADLGPRCGEFVFGGPAQWETRWAEKIKQLYGCEFKQITVTDTGGPVTVQALKSGDAQVVDLFSTDAQIDVNGFVPLEDPKNMFPAQNIVPFTGKGALSEKEKQVLNRLSAGLTTDKLAELDVQYLLEKRNAQDVADEFLRSVGLA